MSELQPIIEDDPEYDTRQSEQLGGIALGAFQAVHYAEDSVSPVKLVEDDALVDAIKQERSTVRAELSTLPTSEEGLDIDRVKRYERAIGFPENKTLYLSERNFSASLDVISGDSSRDAKIGGYYHQGTGTIVVKRAAAYEAIAGTGFTESLAIHEAAHATNTHSTMVVETRRERRLFRKDIVHVNHYDARVGFAVQKHGTNENNRGLFIEEGYAELERGKYIVDELGLQDGFAGNVVPRYPILNKYAMPSSESASDWKFGAYAFAGATLETMVMHDPDLLDALRSARGTVEGLREVAKRMNDLVPGSYHAMHKLDIDAPDADQQAAEMYAHVMKALSAPSD